MSKVVQTGQFFVVGGAVQPDRPCYIARAADEALSRGIRDGQFCYILGPKASGKSSLMARAVRDLRAEDQLVAVVDLAQIGVGDESAEAGRWSYSIAYRITRELRLRVDLQSWWQGKSAITGEQRLAEFFWEVVLPNTSAPITVFLDEIERAIGLPFAKELFGGIRSCYSGRTTEPDLERLNFVVLGVATPRQLCPDPTISPFPEGRAIELEDFTLEESHALATGLDQDPERGRASLHAIHAWAAGHPFLTQKIARGLARRGGAPEDLERVLAEQFLGRGARRTEALLSHIRSFLTGRSNARRQALAILGRVANGAAVLYDPGARAQQILRLSGLIVVGVEGQLTFRNRLFARVFNAQWIEAALPINLRNWSTVIVVVAVLASVSTWYFRYVPAPYVEALSDVSATFEDSLDAHDGLGRLPGFARAADRRLAEVMTRLSREAMTFADVQRTDSAMRGLPGYAGLADRLMGEYWTRRARVAASMELRDEALVLSMRALTGPDEQARRLIAELIGDDYRSLLQSFRLNEAPARWEVDWQSEELVLVDRAHQTRRLRLNGFGALEYENRLTALQHLPVSREVTVNEPGSAGAFQLRISVNHPAPQDLLATLQAPSGALVSFTPGAESSGNYEFAAIGRSPLAVFADENRRGVWRLTLVDRGVGSAGQLIRWGLYFADELRGWEDRPQGLAISDPLRTDQVDVDLSADGRLAIARPTRQSVVGAAALWDLRTGNLVGDVQLDAEPEFLALSGDSSRILAVAGTELNIWDAGTSAPVSRAATQTGFVLPPALTESGGYVAIAEILDGEDSLYSLLRTADGDLVSSVAGLAGVTDWMLAPDARYLVLIGPSRLVRIMDPRSGEIVRNLPHARDPVRLVMAAGGDLLVSIADIGDIVAWDLRNTGGGQGQGIRLGQGQGIRLGQTGDADSVSISANASRLAYQALQGQVVVRDLAGGVAPISVRVNQAGSPIRTRLAPDGNRLLAFNGGLFQLWRLADSEPSSVAVSELTAIGLDSVSSMAVLGFQGGHVRAIRNTRTAIPMTDDPDVDYIGHQGSIGSIAVNSVRGVIVSGGSDGLVRAWELDTGAPTAPFMRHPEGPIDTVAVSGDGQWLASGAELSARIWRAVDGELVREVPVTGRVLSLRFAARSNMLGVGDEAGNIFVSTPESSDPPVSLRASAAATALAFNADATRLVSGDADGNVQLWDPATAMALAEPRTFPQPVRWLGFSDDEAFLLAQTDHWIHRFAVSSEGLTLTGSRLLDAGMEAGAALLNSDGSRLRLIGGRGTGQPRFHEIDMLEFQIEPLPSDSVLLARDWGRILGLQVDDGGEIVPIAH